MFFLRDKPIRQIAAMRLGWSWDFPVLRYVKLRPGRLVTEKSPVRYSPGSWVRPSHEEETRGSCSGSGCGGCDQRRWVYASAKLQNNYFGFGTDNDLEHTDGNVIVHHRTFGRAYPTHGSLGQEARLP